MMKTTRCSILCVLCVLCGYSYSYAAPFSLDTLLSPDTAAELRSEGSVNRNEFGAQEMEIAPLYPPLLTEIRDNITELEPKVMTESLRLWKKPSGSGAWTEAQRTALCNNILAVSTLTGLEYYSRRRERMHILYEKSYVIDNPDDENETPDPLFGSPPDDVTLHVVQEDTSFGENTYSYRFQAKESAFFITQENLSTLTLGPLPAVRKNRMRTFIALFDVGDSLLIYAANLVRPVLLPGMKKQNSESINTRAIALMGWFEDRAALSGF
jgi:hypothetical protein